MLRISIFAYYQTHIANVGSDYIGECEMNKTFIAVLAASTLLVSPDIARADQLIEAADGARWRRMSTSCLLVARGADVRALLGTPLHVAAGTGKEAMVLLLLDNGATSPWPGVPTDSRRCTSPPKRGAPRSSASSSTVAPTSTC